MAFMRACAQRLPQHDSAGLIKPTKTIQLHGRGARELREASFHGRQEESRVMAGMAGMPRCQHRASRSARSEHTMRSS